MKLTYGSRRVLKSSSKEPWFSVDFVKRQLMSFH